MSNETIETLESRTLLSAVSLILVNADTGQDIAPLTYGATINLATMPTRNLSVRANTSPDIGVVRFRYGQETHYLTSPPFAIEGYVAGHYIPWTPTVGQHLVVATGYDVVMGHYVFTASTRSVFHVIDPPVVPVTGNWNSIFTEDFNALPSPNTWVNTMWGATHFAGELENYSSSGVSVAGGILSLTATHTPSGGQPYTSGEIDTGGLAGVTKPGFDFTYGYAEARMKLPARKGLWPAFWMMPSPDSNGNYRDGDGEIDIMEALGDAITRDEVHLHRNGTSGRSYDTGVDLSQSFHTYGVDWEPDHLTFYFDGNPIYSVADTARIPVLPHYLILDLAIGDANSWPGAPDSTTVFPASLQVDYVHVYQKV